MATFFGKVQALLITRISHIAIILLFFIVGMSCTNLTPEIDIEDYSRTVQGLNKIKVAVVVTDEVINEVKKIEVYGKCDASVSIGHKYRKKMKKGVMRSSVNIGSAISKIFLNEFDQLFDIVDIYNKKNKIDNKLYDLIIIPNFDASITYDKSQALERKEVGWQIPGGSLFSGRSAYYAWVKKNCFTTSSLVILKADIFNSKNDQLINSISSRFTCNGRFCFGNCFDTFETDDLLGDHFAGLFSLAINKSFPRLLSQLEYSLIIFAKTKHEQQTLPSSLTVDLIYSENSSFSSNNILDAAENCSIIATIKNKGSGTAFDVKLFTESQISNINFPTSLTVGNILPGESKDVTIPLTTNLSLHTGKASFKIIAKEKRGYDSKTYNLNIQTANLKKPQLFITNSKINDGNVGMAKGNGNGIPENGETIELIPFIKNKGVGRAIKVNLAINSINSGIRLIQKSIEIAEILPGQTVTGKLAFMIPRAYSGGDLKIDLVASDVRGASDDTRVVTLRTQSNRPMLAYSHRIIDSNGNDVLENGEEGYIEITPSNKGRMEARDILIKLSSLDLSIIKSSDEINRIAAGSEYTPLRFPFKVPRTLKKKSVDVQLTFNQKDFPGLTDNIHIPIKLTLPEFTISHQIRDPNNNGIIEQGEIVDLLIRVKNTGGLDADNVKLKVGLDKEGIVYSGPRIIEVGRIAADQTSNNIIFTFHATRRTIPGSLPLIFTVSQTDFPPQKLSLVLNITKEKAQIINIAGQKKPERLMTVTDLNSNSPPMVFIAMPQDQKRVASTFEIISGVAGDDKGISNIEVRLNGNKLDTARTISVTASGTGQRQRNFNFRIPLEIGKNIIEVIAFDIENLSSSKSLTIYRDAEKGELYVAVIGINNYQHVPSLKYARNDAKAFADYMVSNMCVDSDHLFELYDNRATIRAIKSLLGTNLRKKAKRPEDTVYIFFAGHGAPEKDSQSEDGDGITKYILAHDSDPDDLYTTALPMHEVARIFSRIKAQRVVFISDSCYSGGSGGRTILAQNWRANISSTFFDRIVRAGKGRIILTSSNAQEVSQESDKLGHGYFTYYMIEGLKGKADISNDGEVDIDEIYRYVNKKVPDATNGSQHPMKKGEAEGRVIIGRVK